MTPEDTSPFADIEKSIECFNSSISSIEQAYEKISKQIDEYRLAETVPRDYLVELAGNLAHEIRNPLAGIANLVELLSEDPGGEGTRKIEGILNGIERIDKIVENLIVFSRPIVLQQIDCNFRDILKRAVDTIQSEYLDDGAHSYDFQFVRQDDPFFVTIDPILMLQAIQNVLANALTAMPDGGTIVMTLAKQGTYLFLAIQDQGAGLLAPDSEKPFYPFYTTKTYGMGLGLPTSRLILERHGGRIWIETNEDAGVTVKMTLPID